MGEDINLLIFCYALFWATLIGLVANSENKQRTLILNVGIQAVYSAIFLISLATDPFGGGSTLVFLFYLVICIAVHWVINALGLIIIVFGSKDQE